MKKSISVILMLAMLLSSVLAIIPMSAEEGAATIADKLVYEFDFRGDDKFKPAILVGEAMTYVVAEDGRSVTVKGDGATANKTVNMWGGTVAGVKATLSDVYSFTYKVKSNTDFVTAVADGKKAGTAKNNSIGIGAWATDLTTDRPKFYNNFGNHNTAFGEDISMRRTAISNGDTKYGNYVAWRTLEKAVAVDKSGFSDMLIVYDGPAGKISSYCLSEPGEWQLIEEINELKSEGEIGFFTYAYYAVVNTTIKDAKVYSCDITDFNASEVFPPEDTEDNKPSNSSLVYKFNFNGDDKFKPAAMKGTGMDYVASEDGSSVTIKGNGTGDRTVNMWGGTVAGVKATLADVYSFTYKVKAHGDNVINTTTARNNSIGIGAWATDMTPEQPRFYNCYGNHNTAFGDDVSMRRSSIRNGNSTLSDYVMLGMIPSVIAIDSEGFSDMLVVYDGPASMIRTYFLAEDGQWQLINESSALDTEGDIGFFTYAYYDVVYTTIKDARVYSGDISNVSPNGTKVDFGSLEYKSLYDGVESEYNFADVYDVIIDGNSMTTAANSKTSEEKSFNLGYVAQSEYAITSDSYYVYEFKANLNRDAGYAGVVFASNGTEHYFAGGAFANDGDFDDADGNQASHIVLYKNKWAGNLNEEFGDHYMIPVFVGGGYGSWRVIYDGLDVYVQYLAKDGLWTYITHEDGSEASITLPEGYFVAFGVHHRGGTGASQRTISIKDAVLYDLPISDDSGLRPINKDYLNAYIEYVENTFVNSIEYDATSWAALESALAAAKEVSAQEEVLQNVINAGLAALKDAVAALKPNTSELDALISESKGLIEHNYTKESWRVFMIVLDVVERSEKSDYATVMKLYDDLLAAKNALVAIDYGMLKELIARAEMLVKDEYTADSWAALMLALDAAKSALTSADQATVDSFVESLGAAMDALVLNKEGEVEDPTDDIGEKPTGDPVETPSGEIGAPNEDPDFADPMFRNPGCGGVIGTSAVVVALLLGMVALKKKED